jgi:hypothetical protein
MDGMLDLLENMTKIEPIGVLKKMMNTTNHGTLLVRMLDICQLNVTTSKTIPLL